MAGNRILDSQGKEAAWTLVHMSMRYDQKLSWKLGCDASPGHFSDEVLGSFGSGGWVLTHLSSLSRCLFGSPPKKLPALTPLYLAFLN